MENISSPITRGQVAVAEGGEAVGNRAREAMGGKDLVSPSHGQLGRVRANLQAVYRRNYGRV